MISNKRPGKFEMKAEIAHHKKTAEIPRKEWSKATLSNSFPGFCAKTTHQRCKNGLTEHLLHFWQVFFHVAFEARVT